VLAGNCNFGLKEKGRSETREGMRHPSKELKRCQKSTAALKSRGEKRASPRGARVVMEREGSALCPPSLGEGGGKLSHH